MRSLRKSRNLRKLNSLKGGSHKKSRHNPWKSINTFKKALSLLAFSPTMTSSYNIRERDIVQMGPSALAKDGRGGDLVPIGEAPMYNNSNRELATYNRGLNTYNGYLDEFLNTKPKRKNNKKGG